MRDTEEVYESQFKKKKKRFVHNLSIATQSQWKKWVVINQLSMLKISKQPFFPKNFLGEIL